MNFELTDEQQSIQAAIQKICQQFDDAYWLARDTDGTFPEDFVKAITEGGWLGIAMPEAYGGAGLGVTETAIMAHAIARSGAGMSGASAVTVTSSVRPPTDSVMFTDWVWPTSTRRSTRTDR